MIEVKEPISEKMLRDAKTSALLTPRHRPTRIFYISVGSMSPHKASIYANELIDSLKNNIDTFNYENFFLAVREGEHRVEVFYPPATPPAVSRRKMTWGWKLRWPRVR